MSHITAKNAYKSLEERINKFPQGAPPSKTLYQILSILFTEEEARLVAKLPIKAFRLKTAANIWNMSQSEAYKILDNTTVLQSICGRICPHSRQCQGSCIRRNNHTEYFYISSHGLPLPSVHRSYIP